MSLRAPALAQRQRRPGAGISTLQLPSTGTLVRWDDRPFVSPLIQIAGQGRPTGLVLVSAEIVRLLQWQAGLVTEPTRCAMTS